MWRKSRKREFYTRLAHEEGYPARSVYKLEEIQQKYHLIKAGDAVLDLGCAPGSWLLYAARLAGERGRVVGVDLSPLQQQMPENVRVLTGDVLFNVFTAIRSRSPAQPGSTRKRFGKQFKISVTST